MTTPAERARVAEVDPARPRVEALRDAVITAAREVRDARSDLSAWTTSVTVTNLKEAVARLCAAVDALDSGGGS